MNDKKNKEIKKTLLHHISYSIAKTKYISIQFYDDDDWVEDWFDKEDHNKDWELINRKSEEEIWEDMLAGLGK